ncbi:MAG: hypothetical protein FWF15_00630 [Oscillospiraceae bacterium]|nr:hypothetical protein [Oscillospiraceae bacterium]
MEISYKKGQRVTRKPLIKKTGALWIGMEQTPVVFDGRMIFIESVMEFEYREPEKQFYIRARDHKNNKIYPEFAHGYPFASAYTENDVVYVFCTSLRANRPITMYQGDNPIEWYDPRGGCSVMMFWSSDLSNWQSKEILNVSGWRMWNTSVCKGSDGYVMAIEVGGEGTEEFAGKGFTSFFSKSDNLFDWQMMGNDCCYTRDRYNACPALRYFDGWYYMICLEALPVLRYAPYIYRSRDFIDWEVSVHNPVMMYGDDDRVAHPLSNFSEEEKDLLETGININNSDLDLCEFEGRTYIYYANGDQMTYSFLCEAVYDGPLEEFLKGFFE